MWFVASDEMKTAFALNGLFFSAVEAATDETRWPNSFKWLGTE